MNSIILQAAARVLHPALLMVSVFLLVRGHNEPGGGFSGGLVAAAAFILHAMAYGAEAAARALRVEPRMLIGLGLACALLSGLPGMAAGEAFLTGDWVSVPVPGWGEWKVGTPLLFDAGVYLVVIGMTLMIVLNLFDEEQSVKRKERVRGG